MGKDAMKFFVAVIVCLVARGVFAQGIVCQLPADGTWVRFEGSYRQNEIRSDSATGKLEIAPWIEKVWIKSVGSETAEYRGESTQCRWIEIKINRGREKDGGIDTGLTGSEIYKILIPEKAVISDSVDSEGVPVSFLPLVKGYRKIGKASVRPLSEPALQLYPVGILVGYFREWQVVSQNVDPDVGIPSVKRATQLHGQVVSERSSSRSVQESTIWKSAEMPFGIARWSAKIVRETKDVSEPREAFKPVSEVVIEMRAIESGTEGLEGNSELTIP